MLLLGRQHTLDSLWRPQPCLRVLLHERSKIVAGGDDAAEHALLTQRAGGVASGIDECIWRCIAPRRL
jgi:hypothetical protein